MANDDGIIRIGTEVDVSGLTSGMEQAADIVQSSGQSMAEALERGGPLRGGRGVPTLILPTGETNVTRHHMLG